MGFFVFADLDILKHGDRTSFLCIECQRVFLVFFENLFFVKPHNRVFCFHRCKIKIKIKILLMQSHLYYLSEETKLQLLLL